MDLVLQVLPEKPPISNSVPFSHMRRIALEVCANHGLTIRHLKSRHRFEPLVALRFEFFYRAVSETTKSFSLIAKFIGCDHTSVGYGASRYAHQHNLPPPRGYGWKRAREHASSDGKPYPRSYRRSDSWQRRNIDRLIELESRIRELTGR